MMSRFPNLIDGGGEATVLVSKVQHAFSEFSKKNHLYARSFFFAPCGFLLLLELLSAVFPRLMGFGLLMVMFILTGAEMLFYLVFAERLEIKAKNLGIGCFKVCCGILAFFIGGNSILWFQWKLHTRMLTFPALVSGSLFALLFVAFCAGEKGKKFFTNLRDNAGFNSFSVLKEVNPGDIVICNIKEETEANAVDPREVLPLKDRFLHMLIIGATGTGKTSQILLPMILQDIQNPDAGIIILEPKGDLAQKAAMMSIHYGRTPIYFDPSMDNCPHFNPLAGDEAVVVSNIITTFQMLNPDSPQYFQDINAQLLGNAVMVLKRLDKNEGIDGKYSTLIGLSRLLQNSGGQGRDLIQKFSKIPSYTAEEAKQNADIASWFLNDYFAERSKIYENTSGIRSQVAKICSNEFLRDILNPNVMNGEKNELDFSAALEEGRVLCISTAQGALQSLSKYLGLFLIFQLQNAVFNRPGTEDTRKSCFLYIDEFQTYANKEFGNMLTMGRSYRVASHLATQARDQIAMGSGREGRDFLSLVSANASNIVVFPRGNEEDARYFSALFGEHEVVKTSHSVGQKRFNLITGGLSPLGHPTETVREDMELVPYFTPTEIINRPSGEIIYRIIKNNSVQLARVGQVTYIDSDLNKKLDQMVLDMLKTHTRKTHTAIFEEKKAQAASGFTWEDGGGFADGSEIEDPMHGEVQEISLPKPDTSPEPPRGDSLGIDFDAAPKVPMSLHPAVVADKLFDDDDAPAPAVGEDDSNDGEVIEEDDL